MPEVIRGNYLTAVQAAIPETIQTAAEVQKDRVELTAQGDTSLNNVGLWTANVPLYGLLDGGPSLLLGSRVAFMRLYVPHIQEVYSQILTTANHVYTLPREDDEWASIEGLSSGALIGFNLREIFDEKNDNQYNYFSFNPGKASELYGPKRQLLELINGTGDDFLRVMEMLSENGVTESRVYGLNPDFVTSFRNVRLVGRASWLYYFCSDSYFGANGRDVSDYGRLRGVRSVVPAGAGAPNLEQTLGQLGFTNPTAQAAPVPEVVTPTAPKKLKPEENPANPLYEGPNNRFEMLEIEDDASTQPAEEPELSERFKMLELD